MTFDLQQILASKRSFRHALAARDIKEKLRMLDSLCERALALRIARPTAQASKDEGSDLRDRTKAFALYGVISNS